MLRLSDPLARALTLAFPRSLEEEPQQTEQAIRLSLGEAEANETSSPVASSEENIAEEKSVEALTGAVAGIHIAEPDAEPCEEQWEFVVGPGQAGWASGGVLFPTPSAPPLSHGPPAASASCLPAESVSAPEHAATPAVDKAFKHDKPKQHEDVPLSVPPSGIDGPDSHCYTVWCIPGRPLAVGIWCGGVRAWRALLPLLGGRYDYKRGHRLRRFLSLETAVSGYIAEAQRHGVPGTPRVFHY